jgi:4-hydroxyphenylacetate 3-monooxygenase
VSDCPTLEFDVVGDRPETLRLHDYALVVAGYTGSDEQSVRAHIEELEHIGIPAPSSVPAFYPLSSAVVSQADVVQVPSPNSSGETEPVLLRVAGSYYLTLGSDHTDREVERRSVLESKAICPKPIARTAYRLPTPFGPDDWASIVLSSTVDGAPYQQGPATLLRNPISVLNAYFDIAADTGQDIVMFGGTVPIIGGTFRYGSTWNMGLAFGDQPALSLAYRVDVIASDSSSRSPTR